MDNEVPLLLKIVLVLALVAANGFFVAVEFALVRSHLTKLRNPDLKGKLGISSSLKLSENLDFSLSATQLGITISSLVLGWWGATTFHQLLTGCCAWLGKPFSTLVSSAAATLGALCIVTFLHVILGELVAKSLAIRYPEGTLRLLAGPMRLFSFVLRPLIFIMTSCSNMFLRLFGVRTPPEAERVHSLAELAMLVSQSSERGVLDKTEEEMLHGVFSFSDTIAREIMTPRPDLVTIAVDATLDEALDVFSRSGYSRVPVTGDSVDDVVGVVLVRDLLPYAHRQRLHVEKEFSLKKVMREPYFVPATKPIDDLMNEFKRRNTHIAIVLDEHGGVAGAITLEDVLEEIVGDIFDESDTPERDIVAQDNGDVLVDGGVLVADLNERLEVTIPEGEYDTIAGFIYTSLGRMPKAGDEIAIGSSGLLKVNGEDLTSNQDGESDASSPEEPELPPIVAQISVEKVRGRRIETVRLHSFSRQFSEPAADPDASQLKSAISGKR